MSIPNDYPSLNFNLGETADQLRRSVRAFLDKPVVLSDEDRRRFLDVTTAVAVHPGHLMLNYWLDHTTTSGGTMHTGITVGSSV